MGQTRIIRISSPSTAAMPGGQRVTAGVDGTPVWFESPDMQLSPSAEAFASLFLLPALAQGATLVSEAPLDPLWLENSRELAGIFAKWWRYPLLSPQAPVAAPRPASTEPEARDRGLFFSGGVDSFHSLLCCGEQVGLLLLVQGFDIPLDDGVRADAALGTLRSVAAELGVRSGFVRTNLREHPLVRALAWERAHGGALASVGHMVASEAHELLVSSSISTTTNEPWGSHAQTDKLHSSSHVRFRTVATAHRRMQKIQEVALQTLPRHHLRVCWQNRSASGNCSKCDKCVITRLVLAEAGVLDEFTTFEGAATLAGDLAAIKSDKRMQTLDEMSRSQRLDPAIRHAAHALLERSVRAHSLPVRLRRAILRRWLEWARPRSR